MFRSVWAYLGLVLAFVGLLFLGSGCTALRDTAGQLSAVTTETCEKLEASGTNYSATLHLASMVQMDWNPFGFEMGIPGSYADFRVWKGAGQPDAPVELAASTETDDSEGSGASGGG